MNNPMAKVAIIIVTWKGMKWIDKCLTSIRESSYPVTTFIVDNASPDETPNHIAQNYPEMILTRSEDNLGFGKANNIAIAQAYKEGFDYFFLLNQDAYLQPCTVERLLQVAATDKYAIISPIHLNGDGSHIDFYFRDFVLGKCPAYLDLSVIGGEDVIFESDFIPAAAWFLPRKTIEEIGGFDPLFYHYGEDDNYCQRCRFHHRKIVFITKTFIHHDREATVGNSTIYNRKIAFRHIVQDCANINNSTGEMIQRQGRQFYDEIGLWFMYLFTGKWKMLHNFIGDYFKIIFMIPKFKHSRKFNKTIGMNWIDIF